MTLPVQYNSIKIDRRVLPRGEVSEQQSGQVTLHGVPDFWGCLVTLNV